MADSPTFHCSVVTPEEKMLECQARFVAFPAHDGEIGIMRNRAPLVCKLGIGPMRIEADDQNTTLFIDGGFAEVAGNALTVLTEQALRVEDIDADQATQALEQARGMTITDDRSFFDRSDAIKRATTQIQLAHPTRT